MTDNVIDFFNRSSNRFPSVFMSTIRAATGLLICTSSILPIVVSGSASAVDDSSLSSWSIGRFTRSVL